MGWPQKTRRSLGRQAVKAIHRRRAEPKAGAAAASYAGDGEPGFAGDPEWENVHAAYRGRRVGSSNPRRGWSPSRRRVVREGNCGNRKVSPNHCNGAESSPTTRYTWITRMWARSRSEVRTGLPDRRKTRPAIGRSLSANPRLAAEERGCATTILSRMARLAYRRPVTKADLRTLLEFF